MPKKKNARNDRAPNHELLLLIAHLAHSEIHVCELLERTNNKATKEHLQKQLKLITEERIKAMKQLGGNVAVIWCTLKHLLLSYIHLTELTTKGCIDCVKTSSKIMTIIDDLLSSNTITEKTIAKCPRCIHDKDA